jgi:hypothetical protein
MRGFAPAEMIADMKKRFGPMMDKMNAGAVYRDQQYVVSECQSLAAQLAKIAETSVPKLGTKAYK